MGLLRPMIGVQLKLDPAGPVEFKAILPPEQTNVSLVTVTNGSVVTNTVTESIAVQPFAPVPVT